MHTESTRTPFEIFRSIAYAPRGHAKGNPGRREIATACAGVFLPSQLPEKRKIAGTDKTIDVLIGRTHTRGEIARWFEEHGLRFYDPIEKTAARFPLREASPRKIARAYARRASELKRQARALALYGQTLILADEAHAVK